MASERGGTEALLIPLPEDSFAINVDPTPVGGWDTVPQPERADLRRRRMRFRIAHELAHTFFYWRGSRRPSRALGDSGELERFCDAFAAELLLPQAAVVVARPTPWAIVRLQQSFDVSLQLAARQMAQAHPDRRVVVWWRPRGSDKPELRVQWSSRGFHPPTIPAHARAAARGVGRQDGDGWLWLSRTDQLLAVA